MNHWYQETSGHADPLVSFPEKLTIPFHRPSEVQQIRTLLERHIQFGNQKIVGKFAKTVDGQGHGGTLGLSGTKDGTEWLRLIVLKDWSERRDLNSGPLAPHAS